MSRSYCYACHVSLTGTSDELISIISTSASGCVWEAHDIVMAASAIVKLNHSSETHLWEHLNELKAYMTVQTHGEQRYVSVDAMPTIFTLYLATAILHVSWTAVLTLIGIAWFWKNMACRWPIS